MTIDKPKLDGIPYRVIKRLPGYRAALADAVTSGAERVSSQQLATACGCTASQVRQDLSFFGSFGQQGYGYATQELLAIIDHILGIDAECRLALVGVGQLGHALLSYPGFMEKGFRFAVAFDSDPKLIGRSIGGVPICALSSLGDQIAAHRVEIGVIAVPKNAAQEAADALVGAGVKGIWNFAPVQLRLPLPMTVENVNLLDSLMTLAFQVRPRAMALRR